MLYCGKFYSYNVSYDFRVLRWYLQSGWVISVVSGRPWSRLTFFALSSTLLLDCLRGRWLHTRMIINMRRLPAPKVERFHSQYVLCVSAFCDICRKKIDWDLTSYFVLYFRVMRILFVFHTEWQLQSPFTSRLRQCHMQCGQITWILMVHIFVCVLFS